MKSIKSVYKKIFNKENDKRVLKAVCIVALTYVGATLAIKNTKFNINLMANGEPINNVIQE